MKLSSHKALEISKHYELEPHYIDIKDAAERGKKQVEVTYLTKDEFNDLINSGYKIFNHKGTEQYTKWFKELETGETDILIDWEG